jgi:hypothetical protein
VRLTPRRESRDDTKRFEQQREMRDESLSETPESEGQRTSTAKRRKQKGLIFEPDESYTIFHKSIVVQQSKL